MGFLLYIDIYITIGKLKISNASQPVPTGKGNTFRHPYKKQQFINSSDVSSFEMCANNHGTEIDLKFNVGDSLVVFVLICALVIGIVSLYTY